MFNVIEKNKRKKTNTYAYKKLSKMNQQIIEAVHQAQRTATGTITNIAKTYENIAEEKITAENLLQKLTEAEKAGLVEKEVINEQDEPVLGWKTQLSLRK